MAHAPVQLLLALAFLLGSPLECCCRRGTLVSGLGLFDRSPTRSNCCEQCADPADSDDPAMPAEPCQDCKCHAGQDLLPIEPGHQKPPSPAVAAILPLDQGSSRGRSTEVAAVLALARPPPLRTLLSLACSLTI